MHEKIIGIIRSNDLAVLATSFQDRPHCSLMAYAADEKCRNIYMITGQDSQKFQNIMANPHVSILLDTRARSMAMENIQALTISGEYTAVPENEQKNLKELIVKKHPQLKTLAAKPDAIVIKIQIDSFLLLDGVNDAYYLKA
ncbi:MAG: pyridoxamine 5'-phosphate oxidase family protein [Desulfonatronovibrio sp.]